MGITSENTDYFAKPRHNNHPLLHNLNSGEHGTGGHIGIVQRLVHTRNPTVNDDESDATHAGVRILRLALWLNESTGDIFICEDASVGSAVWVLLGSGGSGTIDIYDEGIFRGSVSEIDFVGLGVSATVIGSTATVSIPGSSPSAIFRTKINITAFIPSGTPVSVVASGVGYIKSGDNGFLEISNALFLANNNIRVCPGGAEEEKGVEAIWVNSNNFSLNTDLDPGDYIIIYSS